jgi:hypothetical protein
MSRNEKELKEAVEEIKKLEKEFWADVRIPGDLNELNQEIEKALRLADFFEMGELMALDALERNESCGGHFREESKTEEGEALRDDKNGAYVSGWEYKGEDADPEMNVEKLEMMDILNDNLIREGKEPIAFDHDCREGICGVCSLYVNGRPHGPDDDVTTCQLHMRKFKDGETITIEPYRSKAFPIIKDLIAFYRPVVIFL